MRADVFLVEGGYVQSRRRAQELIKGGMVTLDGVLLRKSSMSVPEGEHRVELTDPLVYVGRGGCKLEGAITAFSISVEGKRAVDIGASTGGFTDCLLRHGARFVTAVDAGYGQLAPTLCSDPRVKNMERCNARTLTAEMVGGRVELVVMDVSFISATYLLPRFPLLLQPGGEAVCLIKPQFEVGPERIGKKGIVKDATSHRLAVERVVDSAIGAGLAVCGIARSPIEGGDGNREFLLYARLPLPGESLPDRGMLEAWIASAIDASKGGCAK